MERSSGHPRLINAFSIDLEDYFHTEVASRSVSFAQWESMPQRIPSTVPRLLELLDRFGVRSTVFVLGWVARRYPALLRDIAARGHELACHSDIHRAVFRLQPEEFREDTARAKASIEDATGCEVKGYRAPSFSITPGTEWAFGILEECGFSYDSSVNPVRHRFYGNPTAPRTPHPAPGSKLLEIPVATWRLGKRNLPVSGGAYLRLLPLTYIASGLKHINTREIAPFTLYMHPWEIDSLQPALHLGWKSHIRQNWGTARMESKLARLFEMFQFAPMKTVYADRM